jgi:type I restriction enzyme S subunit
VLGKCWISDNAISAKSKNKSSMFIFYLLNGLNLNERSEGTGQPLITQGMLNVIKVVVPNEKVIHNFEKNALSMFANLDLKEQENKLLKAIKELLLSKMAKV